jgi:DNA repair exonuclease SbcCD ATPase subunit
MDDEKQIIENTEAATTGDAETQEATNNQAEKLFKQEDVDRIIANRLKQVERKYENVNLEEYQNLKSEAEQAKESQMMKKEQFEELLHKQKNEADQKLAKMQAQLEKVHVDGALLSAASKHKAVNPDHVAGLLKSQVRYNNGVVEVVDTNGELRYNTNTAEPVTLDEAVSEFMTQNAYFKAAQPAGSGANGNAKHTTSREVKLSDLDMNNPEHRALYAQKHKIGNARKFSTK